MKILVKLIRIVFFFLFYIWELILSNLRVLYDVLTPRHYMQPAFVAIPLEAKTDLEILVVSNLISMTPGTLSVDISQDKKYLYIHVMYLTDVDEIRNYIKTKFEARVLEVLR